jgi:hypothetical protein
MKLIIASSVILLAFVSFSCSSMPKSNTNAEKKEPKEITLDFSAGPRTVLYKTKEEYYDKIPVTLSDDKRTIIAYPHPKDIYYKGELALPIRLEKGYLLDNRGIVKNTAFINMTYEAYAKLASAPKLADLEKLILHKDPIIEMCDCGNRYQFKNEIDELNYLITTNQLIKCKKIK